MPEKFNKRFNIDVSSDEARRRFVNRTHNEIWPDFVLELRDKDACFNIQKFVLTQLGDKFDPYEHFSAVIGDDFERNLLAIEACYEFTFRKFGSGSASTLDRLIKGFLSLSETDLGIRWEDGLFYPSGSPLLDEWAVNDVLGLLASPAHAGWLKHFARASTISCVRLRGLNFSPMSLRTCI